MVTATAFVFVVANITPASCLSGSLRSRIQSLRTTLHPPAGDEFPGVERDALLKRLVSLGRSFSQKPPSLDSPATFHRRHPSEIVPGCTSAVVVSASLGSSNVLSVTGSSDAFLSSGLLAAVCLLLEGLPARDVVEMDDTESIAEYLGLRSVLTVGRMDGVENIVRTVQRQTRALLCTDFDPAATSQEKFSCKLPRVAMLLSGGVDSAVAMHLLLRTNTHEVHAYYLKIWLEDELSHLNACPWEDDMAVCTRLCAEAGVPLRVLSLQEEYRDTVLRYTVEESGKGRTPNPDVACNRRVKFGVFLDHLDALPAEESYDRVASGHYAEVVRDPDGTCRLRQAKDAVKDQTYFLSTLSQRQLQRVIFPLGTYPKAEVRALAQKFGLANAQRPDSQGLCFLGKVRFEDFLQNYLGTNPGNIVDAGTGNVVGRHRGMWFHTVGQRKGLGTVLDPKVGCDGPWYVVAKDPQHNVVFVSNKYNEGDFKRARSDFDVENIHWISGRPDPRLFTTISSETPSSACHVTMKIRHGPNMALGTLDLLSPAGDTGRVRLDAEDGGLAPGQFVAFYLPDAEGIGECLGAGVIGERHWEAFIETMRMQRGEEKDDQ
eukprot:CAMPEP_0113326264 /NCGR_PEP_ID=MMETSP0010_2-20120614/18390_1 /TAXON_ID=216773 ORGANISM="Corethron hystrix, Strain 308" /NCGR_SAMPLE_ID=MMETSP0010_2 /ASSEMBLY_ACC=CAM_ASM_000155 /LENGTH=601 /DNA_ID=CAMNT_0000186507 /DNA_START=32 /DNA_END=1834 /DNA_ORIENTATION=+ /assembly_acc=CAM_ASM_000155